MNNSFNLLTARQRARINAHCLRVAARQQDTQASVDHKARLAVTKEVLNFRLATRQAWEVSVNPFE